MTGCAQAFLEKDALQLTYDNSLEILDDSKPESVKNYLFQKYGDSLEIVYDKFGNIRMDYFGSGAKGMSHNFYNAEKHINCAKWKNIDTLFYYDASINEYHLDSTNRIDTPNGFILKYYSQNHADGFGIVQEAHYINDSLHIDPELYKNFKDFSFYEIQADAKLLPVKTILTLEGIRITRNLIRAKQIECPKETNFQLDPLIPSKKY